VCIVCSRALSCTVKKPTGGANCSICFHPDLLNPNPNHDDPAALPVPPARAWPWWAAQGHELRARTPGEPERQSGKKQQHWAPSAGSTTAGSDTCFGGGLQIELPGAGEVALHLAPVIVVAAATNPRTSPTPRMVPLLSSSQSTMSRSTLGRAQYGYSPCWPCQPPHYTSINLYLSKSVTTTSGLACDQYRIRGSCEHPCLGQALSNTSFKQQQGRSIIIKHTWREGAETKIELNYRLAGYNPSCTPSRDSAWNR
jgi:hypothetical protein